MANGGPTAAAGAGGPRPAPPPIHSERVEQKEKLASWWKNFKRSDKKAREQEAAPPQGIFGVPLQTSIRYANVAISLFNDDGQSYIYGYVPIVVAKCGVFLKEKATDVEGIFRLAGSEKRIKELKAAFDSPDRYGKGLDWTGYTVHDAANILRRYFNQLPEPIIPLEFYERFRNPLRNHQAQAVGAIEAQSPSVGDFDQDSAIRIYQSLITELPPLNRQLLLYILDLLAVFASKSDMNKMTTPNLSAIFQPGILSHPQHDMAPPEYRLSQDVLIFLIENQDSFLIGMQGTAADPDTVRDVQSGTPVRTPSTPTTPGRSKTIVGRSASGASAGADSVRKWGNLRRNVSTSSRTSKQSDVGPTPVVSALASPATPTNGVHRSNTVPSRRTVSGAASPRFSREKHSDPSTPRTDLLATPPSANEPRYGSMENTPIASNAPTFSPHPGVRPPEITRDPPSEGTTPMEDAQKETSGGLGSVAVSKRDTSPLAATANEQPEQHAQRSVSNTSSAFSSAGGLLGIFKPSQTSDSEGRRPKKLQKKRIPGSALSSAQSSSQSLEHVGEESEVQRNTATPAVPEENTLGGFQQVEDEQMTSRNPPMPATPQRNPTDATLKPTVSPPHSFHSQTDMSDADFAGDEQPREMNQPQKKRNRWRFSRTQNNLDPSATGNAPGAPIGTMAAMEQASRSTIGSSAGGQPRRSFQEPAPALAPAATDPAAGTPLPPQPIQTSTTDPVFSDSERERKGPMSWIRGKIQERKDKDSEKRTRTPDRHRGERHERHESKSDLRISSNSSMPLREKSVERSQQTATTVVPVAPAEPHVVNVNPAPATAPASSVPAATVAEATVPTNAPSAAPTSAPEAVIPQAETAPGPAAAAASEEFLPAVENQPAAQPAAQPTILPVTESAADNSEAK